MGYFDYLVYMEGGGGGGQKRPRSNSGILTSDSHKTLYDYPMR